MIEQHYSHVQPEMFADALSGVAFDQEPENQKTERTLEKIELRKVRDERRFKEWEDAYQHRGRI